MLRLVGRCSSRWQLSQRFAPAAAIRSTSTVVFDGAVRKLVGSSSSSSSSSSRRTIFATSSAWKGRKGGSSVLRPRPARPTRTTGVAGAGKKKKPKMHGAPFSRIAKDKKIQEKAERDLEAMKTIKLPEGIPYEF